MNKMNNHLHYCSRCGNIYNFFCFRSKCAEETELY